MHHFSQLLKSHPFHFLRVSLGIDLSSICQFVPSHKLLILAHLPPIESVQLHGQSLYLGIELCDRRVAFEDSIEHASHLGQLGQLDGVSCYWLELRQITVAALPYKLDLLQAAQYPAAPAHAQVVSGAEKLQPRNSGVDAASDLFNECGKQGKELSIDPYFHAPFPSDHSDKQSVD